MPRMTAGQAVVACLKAEGVTHIFGIVGHTFLGVLDALYDQREITYLGVRHEQGGAFMADGYARATGRPGVCLVTAGPGAINLLTGIAAAHAAHSPVVALAGGPMTTHYHKDAFQEFDLVSMFKPVTKLALRVDRPERIPELLRHAFRIALTGRRGPVFLELPRDVLQAHDIDAEILPPDRYRLQAPPPANREQVQQAAQVLLQSERPLILAGGGINWSNAQEELVRLAELLTIPLVTAYGHNDVVPNHHPLYIGPLGRAGAPEAAEACRRADTILAVGTKLGQFTTFYDSRAIHPGARLIHSDIDEEEIGRHYPVTMGLAGDAKRVLAQLMESVQQQGPRGANGPWAREAAALRDKRLRRLEGEASLSSMPVKPQRVYAELRKALPPETIVTLDAGAAGAYGYDRLAFSYPRTFFTPLDLGGLGFAFPVALGAKLGRPQAPVLAIHGDGGFLMNALELETAVRCRIPVTTLVMNNNCWGSEKAFQRDLYGARYIGCDLTNPRFDKLAELVGAHGFYVDRPEDIGEALRHALSLDLPSVIEVPIDPEELPDQRHI